MTITLRGAELDAGYSLVSTPSWGTTAWVPVTGAIVKTATQFTPTLGTATPNAPQVVDCMLFR